MRILVSAASRHQGTAEIARHLADALRREGAEVAVILPEDVVGVSGHDGVVLGGNEFRRRARSRRGLRRAARGRIEFEREGGAGGHGATGVGEQARRDRGVGQDRVAPRIGLEHLGKRLQAQAVRIAAYGVEPQAGSALRLG
jgi:hypothetical protein